MRIAVPLVIALACGPIAAAAQGFLPPPAAGQGQPSPFPQAAAPQPSPFPQAAPPQPSPFPQQSGFPPAGSQPSGFPAQPSPFPSAATAATPGAMSAQECGAKFMPLRTETERRAGLIKAGTEKKLPREELCKLFRSYASAETAMLKFMTGNQTACHIPQNIVTQVKTSAGRTAQLTRQVCATAAAAAPPPPSLSQALGTAAAPVPASPPSGGSTFNTLTGSPLAR